MECSRGQFDDDDDDDDDDDVDDACRNYCISGSKFSCTVYFGMTKAQALSLLMRAVSRSASA